MLRRYSALSFCIRRPNTECHWFDCNEGVFFIVGSLFKKGTLDTLWLHFGKRSAFGAWSMLSPKCGISWPLPLPFKSLLFYPLSCEPPQMCGSITQNHWTGPLIVHFKTCSCYRMDIKFGFWAFLPTPVELPGKVWQFPHCSLPLLRIEWFRICEGKGEARGKERERCVRYITLRLFSAAARPYCTWHWIALLIHSALTSPIKWQHFGWQQRECHERDRLPRRPQNQTLDQSETGSQIISESVKQQHILKGFRRKCLNKSASRSGIFSQNIMLTECRRGKRSYCF